MNLDSGALFGIGELARRTKLSVPTIRAWEQRYGFPLPRRLVGGHRRYTQRDADALTAVVAARAAGRTLRAALADARAASETTRSSVFGTLRQELRDTEPFVLSKLSMYAISRAIEDEARDHTTNSLLIGGFQHERYWRASEPRWRHLGRDARAAIVFATLPRRRHRECVWEVPLLLDAPLTHEWFIIFDSPAFSACLVGTERRTGHRVTAARERSRRFEALWTIEATAVRGAAHAACALAFERFPELVEVVEPHWQAPPVTHARSATQLTNRIVRRLDLAKWRT